MTYIGLQKHWYASKVFFNKVFEIEKILQEQEVECYIPCETVLVERNGIKKKVRRPVISSLLFFRSSEKCALELQKQLNGHILLYTQKVGLKRLPSVISEREMNIFILVTSSGEKGLEYFGDDRTDFHVGEPVRVIDGPFKGAEGYIRRIKGNRRLVVTIQGICAVATSYIPQCFLQKINKETKQGS